MAAYSSPLISLVKPMDGLIKLNRTNTFGIGLHSNFEYIMEFHDRNFFIQSQNPAIIKKNMLTIKKNVFIFLYLKVNAFLRGLYHKTYWKQAHLKIFLGN